MESFMRQMKNYIKKLKGEMAQHVECKPGEMCPMHDRHCHFYSNGDCKPRKYH